LLFTFTMVIIPDVWTRILASFLVTKNKSSPTSPLGSIRFLCAWWNYFAASSWLSERLSLKSSINENLLSSVQCWKLQRGLWMFISNVRSAVHVHWHTITLTSFQYSTAVCSNLLFKLLLIRSTLLWRLANRHKGLKYCTCQITLISLWYIFLHLFVNIPPWDLKLLSLCCLPCKNFVQVAR